MVNVNVTLDGREKNVVYGMMSVKYQTVMGMANVQMENVSVLEVSKESFVKKWTVRTLHALDMDFVLMDFVYARKVGKAQIVVKLIMKLFNAFQIALVMANLMLKPKPVSASLCGQARTAPESSVTWTVGFMGIVLAMLVYACLDGLESTVT